MTDKKKKNLTMIYHFIGLFPSNGDGNNTRHEIIDFFSGAFPMFYSHLNDLEMNDILIRGINR